MNGEEREKRKRERVAFRSKRKREKQATAKMSVGKLGDRQDYTINAPAKNGPL